MKADIPVITVDGPSGSGKGTVCRLLAAALGWHMLDSGALYRLVGLAAHNHGVGFDNPAGLEVIAAHLDVQFVTGDATARETRIVLEGEDVSDQLRTEEVGALASQVAAVPVVRAALLLRQRAFCRAPGLVADGRDMGTVVFPAAPLKIFLTAAPEERASRRYKQLIDKGEDVSLPRLVADIRERDARDMEREVAPLKPADDAILLDTTQMSIEVVLQALLAEVRKRGIA